MIWYRIRFIDISFTLLPLIFLVNELLIQQGIHFFHELMENFVFIGIVDGLQEADIDFHHKPVAINLYQP